MTSKAKAWAWDQTLPPTAKLILLAYAESSDDQDQAAPTAEWLMSMTGASETTVRQTTHALLDAGLLQKGGDAIRAGKNGNRLVSVYSLMLDKGYGSHESAEH